MIGDVATFNEYHKVEELFLRTSLELKMELVKEILSTVAKPFQNEGYFSLKALYEKYQTHSSVTLEEELEVLEKHFQLLRNERIERQQ